MIQTLTLTFEVNDDLTSERAAQYRAAILHALSCVDVGEAPSCDDNIDHWRLTHKLLHDVNEQPAPETYKATDGTILDTHGRAVQNEENFEHCLGLFLAMAQGKINTYYADSFPNNEVPALTLQRNKKYIRVVKERGNDLSVYCFIDTTNGDILKGSWKAPVRNGVRGNIYAGDHGADRVNHHGCIYLR